METNLNYTVFIPGVKNDNPFFNEIVKCTETKFVYDELEIFNDDFDMVLIHWPEQLVNWELPSEADLLMVLEHLKQWKEKTKIIYVVNNEKPHIDTTSIIKKLYDIVENHCDIMVHLGEFSFLKFKKKYPSIRHAIIPHPLYNVSFNKIDKNKAREKLKFSQNAIIMVVPGRIRLTAERKLILRAFKKLPAKDKILVVPYMLRKKIDIEFKGRTQLKKVVDIKKILEKITQGPMSKKHFFGYSFVSFKELSLTMSAADIVFIPRISALNSGNLFLGLTFGKVIVGPRIGNISEYLAKFNLPTYNPKNMGSLTQAMEHAQELLQNNVSISSDDLNFLHPLRIAQQWDTLIRETMHNG